MLSSNISSTCPLNMVNFGPLVAEIVSLVWGHPSKFQRLSRLGSVTARHSSSGRQPKFAALNRGRHLHSAGWPSRWALAHILVLFSLRNLSGRRVDVYHTSTIYTWCGLSANLECRSEMCCTGLAGNTGRKYDATRMFTNAQRDATVKFCKIILF